MRQPDKHNKIQKEILAEKEREAEAKAEEEIPTEPEDGDIIDGPDGTFAESVRMPEPEEPDLTEEPELPEDSGVSEEPELSEESEPELPEEPVQEEASVPEEEIPAPEEPEPDPTARESVLFEELAADSRNGEASEEEEDPDSEDTSEEPAVRTGKKKKEKPLWQRKPEKYRKRRPFIVRFLSGLFAFIFFWVLAVGVIGVIGLGVAATVVYSFTDSDLDDKLANLELDYTSIIYANSLETGGYVPYEELYSSQNRVWVSIDEMPSDLTKAVIAIEDKRFYQHHGVDIITTGKATVNWILAKLMGKSTSGIAGGSTLTQQLVKNISDDWDNSPIRKIKEMLRALYIERKYSKEQILEYYLNAVTFGNNQEGIYAAAHYYFDKEVSQLSLTECAAVVAITKSPRYIEPYNNPDENKKRRQTVMYYMYEQGLINKQEYEMAVNQNLRLRDRDATSASSVGVMSWFSDMVFEDVKTSLMEKKGYTASQAVNLIYTGGLRIYTTMVTEYQQICEDYFYDDGNYLELEEGEEQPEVAFELFDPSNGNVLAVIGGRGEKSESRLLNRATQTKRQPGSAIKPVTVYGYAIENNIVTAATAIDDSPLLINMTQIKLPNGMNYYIDPLTGKEITMTYSAWPTNYDNTYNGYLDVKTALCNSYNTPAAKVLSMIGVENSFNFAKNMLGLKSLVAKDKDLAPLSVGALTYGLTLQELTAAYTSFANGGIYSSPRCVVRVETYDGKILYENEVDKEVVFTPQTAYIVTDILESLKGSAGDAELENYPTAGKSGTTTSFKDRWFIGYTPTLLAGIWWGYDQPNTNENTHHINMWHDVMTLLMDASGDRNVEFAEPDGIETSRYCSVSGKLATKACLADQRSSSRVKTGIYKSGTVPTEYCDMHHYIYVCSDSGQIATQYCTNVEQRVFIDSDRSYPNIYVRTKDAEFVCPDLYPDTVLYNSQILPVYTYMVPEGEYPSLPVTQKKRYANCICHLHAHEGENNHYYTYNFLTQAEKEALAAQEALSPLPSEILLPDTVFALYNDTEQYNMKVVTEQLAG